MSDTAAQRISELKTRITNYQNLTALGGSTTLDDKAKRDIAIAVTQMAAEIRSLGGST